MLLKVLHDFADAGNTVLVVEHNLDVIKTADWVIDLGPEGGSGGGQIVAVGTPEEVARESRVVHGPGAGAVLESGSPRRSAKAAKPRGKKSTADVTGNGQSRAIIVRGARQHNLKGDRRRDSPRPNDRLLRPERFRKKLAGDGHDLCRGAAPLRRKPELLRPAVRRANAKAEGRSYRRAVAGHRHRTEAHGAHAAVDRRHRDRNLRLFPDSDGAARHSRIVRTAIFRSARNRPTKSSTRSWPSRRARSCT